MSCCLRHVTDGSLKCRLFRFPADAARRQLWTQNCRRIRPDFELKEWHRLCEKHFDDAQFESHRVDGQRKLRPDAVPLLFDVPVSLPSKKRYIPVKHDEHMYSKKSCANVSVAENRRSQESFPSTELQPIVLELPADFIVEGLVDADSDTDQRDEPVLSVGSECGDKLLQQEIHQLRLEIRRLKWQLRQSDKREANLTANIAKFLNADQLEKLKRSPKDKSHGVISWSSSTIQRCLAIRSVVGRNGYEYLRSLQFPLPSYRTLCRRIQNTPFASGIQHDVLQWLKLKMDGKPDYEKLCVLLVDEMQIKSRVEYDKGLKRVVGYVSPETIAAGAQPSAEKEIAAHAMVFMLRGLTSSWKQTVAYLFTGTTLKREPYWDFTRRVIKESEAAGFRIQCITSDMGPVNTALWNHVGILSTRSGVSISIPHPVTDTRSMYFVADPPWPPHQLKNLWNCLLVNKLSISQETAHRHSLPSTQIDHVYINQMLDLQQYHELRVAYKLNDSHVSPTQYQKMRVCLASQFFSHSTAAALKLCVRKDLIPAQALTTAWFLGFVNDWFDAVNARHKDASLFCGKRTSRTDVLEEMLQVIRDLSFNGRKVWKPVQTGIQLSTTVALQLSQELMQKFSLLYFMTGRLSQDPVENLFSQARGQGVMHPSCTVFRQALRLVTIAQYLHVSKGSAYEEDGCTYLVDYLKDKRVGSPGSAADSSIEGNLGDGGLLPALLAASAEAEITNNDDDHSPSSGFVNVSSSIVEEVTEEVEEDTSVNNASRIWIGSQSAVNIPPSPLDSLEDSALYDVIGWSLSRFFQTVNCDTCKAALVADVPSDDDFGVFTDLRSYGGLTHPTKQVFSAAKMAESVFSTNKSSFHRMADVESEVTGQIVDVLDACGFDFPTCHRALYKLMKRFVRLRLNSYAATESSKQIVKKQYGSKTAIRITLIP